MKRLMLLITAAAALALMALPAAALAKSHDRNHDGIPDKWERHFHLSLYKNDAKGDPDHYCLNNKREFKNRTNPRDADTDNDGMEDGAEVETANNPRDADTDNNGVVTEATGDWNDIELISHREITIQVGTPIAEVPNYTWSAH